MLPGSDVIRSDPGVAVLEELPGVGRSGRPAALGSMCARLCRTAIRALRQNRHRGLIVAVVEPELRHLTRLEVADRHNYQVANDGDGPFAALWLHPGQRPVHRGIRSELSIDYHCTQGQTVRYSWELRLPPEFNGSQARGRWWILGQWHDQPDRTRGEDWRSHPARPAPVQILYRATDDAHQLALRYGAPSPEVVGFAEVPGDAWIGVSALVHWSRGPDGWAALSLGGQASRIVASGANMHNNYAHFLKVGTYRDPEIQAPSCVHVRRISIRMGPT